MDFRTSNKTRDKKELRHNDRVNYQDDKTILNTYAHNNRASKPESKLNRSKTTNPC